MYRFMAAHVMKAQKVLRHAAGMWEETFNEQQFVEMLSDELRLLRDKNMSWEEISDLLRTQAHIEIEPTTLAAYIPEPRRKKRRPSAHS